MAFRKYDGCFWLNRATKREPRIIGIDCTVWPPTLSAASLRYSASIFLRSPETCFMAWFWAEEPTRDTDRPMLTAGR